MLIARSTISQASVSRSNPAGEASRGKHVSRSASEPWKASLRKERVASLPEMMKPDIGGEETGKQPPDSPGW